MKTRPVIVWFRHDLRLSDNPALAAALATGKPVLPAFIWAPEEESPWAPGAAARLWFHDSLAELDRELRKCGVFLVLRRGPSLEALLQLAKESHAEAVFWNRRYEPAVVKRDQRIKEKLREAGLQAESFNGALLREPWTLHNRSGKPFQVFTAYWRACLESPDPSEPLPAPKQVPATKLTVASAPLSSLGLDPGHTWTAGVRQAWKPGSSAARAELDRFLEHSWENYNESRNRPDQPGTSRLSPYLHLGQISPRQVWHALRQRAGRQGLSAQLWRRSQFLAEIGWREFAHQLLFYFPHTTDHPLRPEFEAFPWRANPAGLRAWQRGLTGVPLVDAGMRQLWATGWMHNRVRMVVASFLVKNLLVSWQEGTRWFWDTLVDADLASNTLGWQWTAGCGADAAPYFRVFNPVTQTTKFDPNGDYIRRWLPELARLPARWIASPAQAPAIELDRAGVVLGRTYPEPIVSLIASRHSALDAYQAIKKSPRNQSPLPPPLQVNHI